MTIQTVSIVKNLTASGKSVFWALNAGTKFICRVGGKKSGIALANLINIGDIDSFFMEYEPSQNTLYITDDFGGRVCSVTKKATDQLYSYLQSPEHQNTLSTRSAQNRNVMLAVYDTSLSESEVVERLEQYHKHLEYRVAQGEKRISASSSFGQSTEYGENLIKDANSDRKTLESVLSYRETLIEQGLEKIRIAKLHRNQEEQRVDKSHATVQVAPSQCPRLTPAISKEEDEKLESVLQVSKREQREIERDQQRIKVDELTIDLEQFALETQLRESKAQLRESEAQLRESEELLIKLTTALEKARSQPPRLNLNISKEDVEKLKASYQLLRNMGVQV